MQDGQENLEVKDTAYTQEVKAKRTIKDSVFSDLFQNKKYLLQLYKHFIQKTRRQRKIRCQMLR